MRAAGAAARERSNFRLEITVNVLSGLQFFMVKRYDQKLVAQTHKLSM